MKHYNTNTPFMSQVASELESMRCLPAHAQDGVEFPAATKQLLYSLPGNNSCVDCGSAHPQWASVSFGTLLCLQCSGQHRGLGVKTSRVRSVEMDTWSHAQVLAMLEGGNLQLSQFLERHRMGNANYPHVNKRSERYHTKAAQFYRVHLAKHAQDVASSGVYLGREAARQKHYNNAASSSAKDSSCAGNTSAAREEPRCQSVAVAQ